MNHKSYMLYAIFTAIPNPCVRRNGIATPDIKQVYFVELGEDDKGTDKWNAILGIAFVCLFNVTTL
jgi:hypothetical protein